MCLLNPNLKFGAVARCVATGKPNFGFIMLLRYLSNDLFRSAPFKWLGDIQDMLMDARAE